MAFGDYPADYNPKVHGPYDPARYYGKADTPLAQVKLGEFGQWLMRRNKSPQAMVACGSRAFWRWQHKYCQAKRAGIAPFLQVSVAMMATFYYLNYYTMRAHRTMKYH
ncbi:putative ATP synthase subunit f, mitochondrial [Homalodisca vitripennis]|uniref:putative ATP synthase subunit f, mitochondrial n=1 Tax=Homalodisca vitripennis TaxID=197043 RepID=UPI001EE9B377|nr:putative ATP synthase subunit f, mitochondrial [Homalodisca vitripennis]